MGQTPSTPFAENQRFSILHSKILSPATLRGPVQSDGPLFTPPDDISKNGGDPVLDYIIKLVEATSLSGKRYLTVRFSKTSYSREVSNDSETYQIQVSNRTKKQISESVDRYFDLLYNDDIRMKRLDPYSIKFIFPNRSTTVNLAPLNPRATVAATPRAAIATPPQSSGLILDEADMVTTSTGMAKWIPTS